MSPRANTAKAAEQARLERDGEPTGGSVHVRVIADTAIVVGENVCPPGETFVAAEPAVRDAIARGLLEVIASV